METKFYGVLLEDLTFKSNESPDSFIEYFVENELNLPRQAIAGKDAYGEYHFFGVKPVYTKDSCEFQDMKEIKKFIIKTLKPFVESNKDEILKIMDNYSLFTEE